jgi:hypothetical protein
MRYNVPRMGVAGGFVHSDTGRFDCGDKKEDIVNYEYF